MSIQVLYYLMRSGSMSDLLALYQDFYLSGSMSCIDPAINIVLHQFQLFAGSPPRRFPSVSQYACINPADSITTHHHQLSQRAYIPFFFFNFPLIFIDKSSLRTTAVVVLSMSQVCHISGQVFESMYNSPESSRFTFSLVYAQSSPLTILVANPLHKNIFPLSPSSNAVQKEYVCWNSRS